MLLSFNSPIVFADALEQLQSNKSSASVVTTEDNLTQYDINVKFNEPNKAFTVTESVKFTNTYGKNLKSLVFHLYADSYGSVETMPSMGIQKEKLEE